MPANKRVQVGVCRYCLAPLYRDDDGDLVDETDGDGCSGHPETGANENEPHQAGEAYHAGQ